MSRKFLSIILMFTSVITWSSSDIAIKTIFCSPLDQERNLFVKSWLTTYQNYSLQQLGLSDLTLFLQESFDKEESDSYDTSKKSLFFHAINKSGRVIGYVSFDIEDQVAYVRQWAMLPEEASVDLLRNLVFVIFDYQPNISSISAIVRHVAQCEMDMLIDLGFEVAEDIQKGFDPAFYSTMTKMFSDKCGTCMCDYDDNDFENGLDDMNFQESCGCPGSDIIEQICGCSIDEQAAICPYSLED